MKKALLIAALCASFSAFADDVLFPEARHFVRRVEDPLSNKTTTLQEYCAGNQIVVVNGGRVSITDYGKQEVIEIDRGAGTYSVTRFDELARLQVREAPRESKWIAKPRSVRRSAVTNRSLETIELQRDTEAIEIGVDRRVTLTPGAAEVLIGAAYPNVRKPEHDAILGALRIDANAYAMPVEESTTYDVDGQSITLRSSVVDVTNDRVPHDLVVIPPGAVRVESHAVRTARMLRELDQLPGEQKP